MCVQPGTGRGLSTTAGLKCLYCTWSRDIAIALVILPIHTVLAVCHAHWSAEAIELSKEFIMNGGVNMDPGVTTGSHDSLEQ